MSVFSSEIFRRFFGNGWEWEQDFNEEDYITYKMTFLSLVYNVTCYARVSECPKNLAVDGHYGVMWLEFDYENNHHSVTEGDIKDMLYGFELAENNLLNNDVPFVPDYKFHGRNKWNMKRKNDTIRRKLHLDELEEKDNAER